MIAVLKRGYARLGEHKGDILAAGITYYVFLSLVPLLGAAVLGYGLIVSPERVADHIAALAQRLPQSAAELIGTQLQSMVTTSGAAKGFGLVIAIALALFGARNAAGSLVRAVAMAFGDDGDRPFLRANALALAMTVGGILAVGIVIAAMSASSAITAWFPDAGQGAAIAGQVLSYAILLAAAIGGAAALYRRAPRHVTPSWRSLAGGAIFAGIGTIALTALFDFYVSNFGSYNATYGSLGAVVVLLTWLWLVAYVILFGAEIAAVQQEPV